MRTKPYKTITEAADEFNGMTVAEIRDALKSVPEHARIRVKTVAAFHSDGGRIGRITVTEGE